MQKFVLVKEHHIKADGWNLFVFNNEHEVYDYFFNYLKPFFNNRFLREHIRKVCAGGYMNAWEISPLLIKRFHVIKLDNQKYWTAGPERIDGGGYLP